MANLLTQGSAFLATQLLAHAATEIVYSRGDDSAPISAVVGKTSKEIQDGNGVVHRWESRDYLIRASDLRLSGKQVAPQEGDRITERGQGRATVVHEVRGAALGTAPWEWSDPSRALYRIHTVYLGVEDEG